MIVQYLLNNKLISSHYKNSFRKNFCSITKQKAEAKELPSFGRSGKNENPFFNFSKINKHTKQKQLKPYSYTEYKYDLKPKKFPLTYIETISDETKQKASKNIFWGALLFSRGDLAFINLCGLLSSLLKVLHVCAFATLNNKRIIFVGDARPLVQEHQQALLKHFISSQVNSFSTKMASKLPLLWSYSSTWNKKVISFAEYAKENNKYSHQQPQPKELQKPNTFAAAKQAKVKANKKKVLPSDANKANQKESWWAAPGVPRSPEQAAFLLSLLASKWQAEQSAKKHNVNDSLIGKTKASKKQYVNESPIGKTRAFASKAIDSSNFSEDNSKKKQKSVKKRLATGVVAEKQQLLLKSDNKEDLQPKQGLFTNAKVSNLKAVKKETTFAEQSNKKPFCEQKYKGNSSNVTLETTKLQNKIKNKLLIYPPGSIGALFQKKEPKVVFENTEKLESQVDSLALKQLIKLVSKAGVRSSQWTATLAQPTNSWVGGFFSNGLISYRKNLSSATLLNIQMEPGFSQLQTTNLGKNTAPLIAPLIVNSTTYTKKNEETLNSNRSKATNNERDKISKALQSDRVASPLLLPKQKLEHNFIKSSSLSVRQKQRAEENYKLREKGKEQVQALTVLIDNFEWQNICVGPVARKNWFVSNSVEEEKPYGFKKKDLLPNFLGLLKGRKVESLTTKGKQKQPRRRFESPILRIRPKKYYQKTLNNCGKLALRNSKNPWLKEADLVFFTNPEKSRYLLSQINRLQIPTIGIVSSGSALSKEIFRNVKGYSSSSSKKPVINYPIIGNPISLNFLRIILTKIASVLNH